MAKRGRTPGTEKTGGRKKGTTNRATADMREFVQSLLDENRNQIKTDMENIEPHQRLSFYEKLLGYVLPKPQSIDARIDFNSFTDSQIDGIITALHEELEDEDEDQDEDEKDA